MLIKKILMVLLLTSFVACSPQKRLNRLLKNNPELVKTDTVTQVIPIYLPGLNIDTNFKANSQVEGLNEILNHYIDVLDSLKKIKLTTHLAQYITNRECLKDTFIVPLQNKGFCKIWQKGNLFFYQLRQPGVKKLISVPVTINQVTGTLQKDWKLFWIGAVCGLVLIFVLQITVNYINHKKNSL